MMGRIGIMVVQDEEEELGPMIITRIIWEVHGIHQSLHPTVRHGELPPSAKGVMASSLSFNPMIGKCRGT